MRWRGASASVGSKLVPKWGALGFAVGLSFVLLVFRVLGSEAGLRRSYGAPMKTFLQWGIGGVRCGGYHQKYPYLGEVALHAAEGLSAAKGVT